MRILCANRQADCDAGLYWGLRQLGQEIRICELRWLPAGQRAEAWRRAWMEFRPDLVFFSGYWHGRYELDDLDPPRRMKKVPLVYWAYDDPVFTTLLSMPVLPRVSLILTPAEECLEIYARHRCRTGFLQFAYTPEVSSHNKQGESHQFVLVAHNYTQSWTTPFRLHSMRAILLPLVEKGYDIKVWGNFWDSENAAIRLPPRLCGGYLPHERLPDIYNGASIVLGLQFNNLSRSQTSSRVFETLGCGVFYLGPDTRGTRRYFECGRHLVLSGTPQDTLALAGYYLDNHDARRRIAAAGQLEVRQKHTYLHRAKDFMAAIEKI